MQRTRFFFNTPISVSYCKLRKLPFLLGIYTNPIDKKNKINKPSDLKTIYTDIGHNFLKRRGLKEGFPTMIPKKEQAPI